MGCKFVTLFLKKEWNTLGIYIITSGRRKCNVFYLRKKSTGIIRGYLMVCSSEGSKSFVYTILFTFFFYAVSFIHVCGVWNRFDGFFHWIVNFCFFFFDASYIRKVANFFFEYVHYFFLAHGLKVEKKKYRIFFNKYWF